MFLLRSQMLKMLDHPNIIRLHESVEDIEAFIGRGNDTAGNPHRAQIVQFELFEFVLLLK